MVQGHKLECIFEKWGAFDDRRYQPLWAFSVAAASFMSCLSLVFSAPVSPLPPAPL